MKTLKYVKCSKCGSTNLSFDGSFFWDFNEQKDVIDNIHSVECDDCRGEEVEEVEFLDGGLRLGDVHNVAGTLGITLTETQAIKCLELYPTEMESDPTATWNLIIENIIHNIV